MGITHEASTRPPPPSGQSSQWVSSWMCWLVRRLHSLEALGTEVVQGIIWWVLPTEILAYHYLHPHGILMTCFALNLIKPFFLLPVSCSTHSFCPSVYLCISLFWLSAHLHEFKDKQNVLLAGGWRQGTGLKWVIPMLSPPLILARTSDELLTAPLLHPPNNSSNDYRASSITQIDQGARTYIVLES